MTDKIKVQQAIVVEGKYDKIKLSSFIDGMIIVTGGFGVFNDTEKKNYLRKLADERGLLIITDSDSAGFMIRNHLKSFIDDEKIFNAYIPSIHGKERRKQQPSKDGTLGVEGMTPAILLAAIKNSGALSTEDACAHRDHIYSYTDLFNMGLTGSSNCGERKANFLSKLGLPKGMSNSALIKYLNTADEDTVAAAAEDIKSGI